MNHFQTECQSGYYEI